MRIRILAPTLSLAAAVVLGLAGCNRESPKGGPGADKANKGAGASDKADSFTVKVPAGNTNVTQGEQKEITISVSRGDKFDQDVKLTFKAPDGVTVTPESVTNKKGGEDAKITVKAADTATVGTTNIKVTGTPATGSAATVDLGIEIKKK
jgi:uncharacterized membrane protein